MEQVLSDVHSLWNALSSVERVGVVAGALVVLVSLTNSTLRTSWRTSRLLYRGVAGVAGRLFGCNLPVRDFVQSIASSLERSDDWVLDGPGVRSRLESDVWIAPGSLVVAPAGVRRSPADDRFGILNRRERRLLNRACQTTRNQLLRFQEDKFTLDNETMLRLAADGIQGKRRPA